MTDFLSRPAALVLFVFFFANIRQTSSLQFILQRTYYSHDWDVEGCTPIDPACRVTTYQAIQSEDYEMEACFDYLSAHCMLSADFDTATMPNAGCAAKGMKSFSVASPYNILANAEAVEYISMTVGGINYDFNCSSSDWWLEVSNESSSVCREINQTAAIQIRPTSVEMSIAYPDWIAVIVFDITSIFKFFGSSRLYETFHISNLATGCDLKLVNANGPAVSYRGTTIHYGRNGTLNSQFIRRPQGLPAKVST